MNASLSSGRVFRAFNVIDDYNREGLALAADVSLPGERITGVLDRVAQWRGCARQLRCDNGPELISACLEQWATDNGVQLCFIEPGGLSRKDFAFSVFAPSSYEGKYVKQ